MGTQEETLSSQYLLMEFTDTSEGLRQLGDLAASRVNIHLTLVTAVVGALFVLYTRFGFNDQLLSYAILVALFVVLVVGLLIYAEMVDFVIRMIVSDRVKSTIREYFLLRDPEGLETFINVWNVERRIYVRRRTVWDFLAIQLGAKQIITVLNNAVSATLGLIATYTFLKGIDPAIFGLIGALCFIGIWFVQYVYSRIRYRIAEADLEQRAIRALRNKRSEETHKNQNGI